jgi:ribosomal protein L4
MTQSSRAHVGDLVVVHGHRLGESSRTGEILEVLGAAEHEHYRVQWEDGHESVFTRGSDALIRHVEQSEDDELVLTHEP